MSLGQVARETAQTCSDDILESANLHLVPAVVRVDLPPAGDYGIEATDRLTGAIGGR